jgi:putative CocE/NonD family hydrolase
MGDNRWRDEQTWPLPRAVNTKLFLQSDGNAADPSGDGQLLLEAPFDTHTPDVFTYNPLNPVPTRGGAFMGPGIAIKKQNTIELRPDVLSYTSSPLAENVEVTGYVRTTLVVSTNAPSTDFTAKLVDVYPDGSAYNIADGILRQTYDVGDQRVSIVIQLGATSNVFQKGHRIRLDVSSSNFPLFDRNPNTGTPIAFETRAVASLQKIHHDASAPSFVELPIVPVKNGAQLIRFRVDE